MCLKCLIHACNTNTKVVIRIVCTHIFITVLDKPGAGKKSKPRGRRAKSGSSRTKTSPKKGMLPPINIIIIMHDTP